MNIDEMITAENGYDYVARDSDGCLSAYKEKGCACE